MDNVGLHVKKFNDKVRALNQSGGKDLVMTASDARNLHSEIFDLLAKLSEFSSKPDQVSEVSLDGGSFK